MREGKVWFIGAGPGDPELITVKGARLIAQADLVLYAGSLVPPEIVAGARDGAQVLDSSGMTLARTHELLRETARAGGLAARVHTGDPSLYGAVREQMALLEADGIDYAVVPGVTAAFAAAAEARVSFTAPEVTQSLIITRLAGRTPVPEAENLAALAAHGSAMAIYLSGSDPLGVQSALLAGGFAPETEMVVGHRVGWPGGGTMATTLAELPDAVERLGAGRQLIFLALPGGTQPSGGAVSRLYAPEFAHGFREAE